jgi:hypothetical protein
MITVPAAGAQRLGPAVETEPGWNPAACEHGDVKSKHYLPVPDTAMDYQAIYGRGAHCCGDEDFALYRFLCCESVRLVCYEDDIVYLDPNDLSRQGSYFVSSRDGTSCPVCGAPTSLDETFFTRATWSEAAASLWSWTILHHAWPPEFHRHSDQA